MGDFGGSPAVEFVTGATAALIDCLVFHSVDTLKVRAQDNRPLLPWDTLRKAPAARQPLLFASSLYAGFSTNVALKVPYMALMFGCHSANKAVFDLLLSDDPKRMSAGTREALSATLVGLEASVLLSPLELLRIQGQNCGRGGLIQATNYFVRHQHWSTLGQGFTACAHREMKYTLGQFFGVGVTEAAVARWAAERHESHALARQVHESPSLRVTVSSLVVGFLCTVVSQPDDVVKTRMQSHLPGTPEHHKYRTFLGSLRTVVHQDGALALWKGSLWRCVIRVPFGLVVLNLCHPMIRPWAELGVAWAGL